MNNYTFFLSLLNKLLRKCYMAVNDIFKNIIGKPNYFDKHLECKHHGKNVIGCAQKHSLVTVRRYVWSLHGQRDAVQRDESEHQIVEPLLLDKLPARYSETLSYTPVVSIIRSTSIISNTEMSSLKDFLGSYEFPTPVALN